MAAEGERAAVIQWSQANEIGEILVEELEHCGLAVRLVEAGKALPADLDYVLTYGPYGPFLPAAVEVGASKAGGRPVWIHWNTELIPDPRLPWGLVRPLALFRSWLGRRTTRAGARAMRLRYVGDSHFAARRGWLDLLVESSRIYAGYHCRHGLPAVFIPWGTSPRWHSRLELVRDIDVLWMGKRRSRRRSELLEAIRAGLAHLGYQMWLIDGQEHPFVYGQARTEILNRSKIMLNLLSSKHDNALIYRFPMGAGNRSLVVSEPTLAHDENLAAGVHYVESRPEDLVETLAAYLQDGNSREPLVEAAYQLVTTRLAFCESVRKLLALARGQAKAKQKIGPQVSTTFG